MKPRANGKLLVPQELADQWQNGDQNKLLEEFQKANFDKDLFVKNATKRIRQHITEKDLWVDGDFVSEQDMKDEGISEKRKRDLIEQEDSDVGSEDLDGELDVGSCEQQRNEAADAHAAAGKMLKKITFPEMDDDALPSTYCIKVLGCLGKWSAKMYDLAELVEKAKTCAKELDNLQETAPAKVVAEKSNAMAEEFGPGFAQRSLGTRGRSFKNASRQYKLLGVARNYLASCILLMGSMGLFDEGVAGESCSVGARLERAYGSLRLFCQVQKLGLRLRGFTIQNFHQGPNQAFPYVGSKGSDTIIIMKWLLFFARLQLE
ncbi:unnamed protein product, partial [Durusdinium trenchii]